MLAKLKTLPQLADVSTDQQSNAPQLTISINRDQAARFGIQPQVIDDTLNDAFGQRQVAQYFTQTNTYHVVLEVPPGLQGDLEDARPIYLKSPLTGSRCRSRRSSPSTTRRSARSRSRIRASSRRSRSRSTCRKGVALGQAVDAIQQGEAATSASP